jgi:hypothetical protein
MQLSPPPVTSSLLRTDIFICTLFSNNLNIFFRSLPFRLLLQLSYLAYISTLKMEAICSSETSVPELHSVTAAYWSDGENGGSTPCCGFKLVFKLSLLFSRTTSPFH